MTDNLRDQIAAELFVRWDEDLADEALAAILPVIQAAITEARREAWDEGRHAGCVHGRLGPNPYATGEHCENEHARSLADGSLIRSDDTPPAQQPATSSGRAKLGGNSAEHGIDTAAIRGCGAHLDSLAVIRTLCDALDRQQEIRALCDDEDEASDGNAPSILDVANVRAVLDR